MWTQTCCCELWPPNIPRINQACWLKYLNQVWKHPNRPQGQLGGQMDTLKCYTNYEINLLIPPGSYTKVARRHWSFHQIYEHLKYQESIWSELMTTFCAMKWQVCLPSQHLMMLWNHTVGYCEATPTEMYRFSYEGVLIALEMLVVSEININKTFHYLHCVSLGQRLSAAKQWTNATNTCAICFNCHVLVLHVFVLHNELTYQLERRNRSNCCLDSSPVISKRSGWRRLLIGALH